MSYDHEEVQVFWRNGNFFNLPAEIRDSNMVLWLSTIFWLSSHWRWVQPKYTWSRKDVGSPKSTSLLSTFHIGSMLCFSFQSVLCHPHTQIRIVFFHDEQRDIPNLEFSPIHVSIGLSQIAFPIIVLPIDDHSDFVQEERLGFPYWTMFFAICAVVDESKCLDTPILEFWIICEHHAFLVGYKLILRFLLVHRNLTIWIWYPWSQPLSFEMLKILIQ